MMNFTKGNKLLRFVAMLVLFSQSACGGDSCKEMSEEIPHITGLELDTFIRVLKKSPTNLEDHRLDEFIEENPSIIMNINPEIVKKLSTFSMKIDEIIRNRVQKNSDVEISEKFPDDQSYIEIQKAIRRLRRELHGLEERKIFLQEFFIDYVNGWLKTGIKKNPSTKLTSVDISSNAQENTPDQLISTDIEDTIEEYSTLATQQENSKLEKTLEDFIQLQDSLEKTTSNTSEVQKLSSSSSFAPPPAGLISRPPTSDIRFPLYKRKMEKNLDETTAPTKTPLYNDNKKLQPKIELPFRRENFKIFSKTINDTLLGNFYDDDDDKMPTGHDFP